MLNPDLTHARPVLTATSVLATALGDIAGLAQTKADVWRLLTERYVVDLDAVAALLPRDLPEPVWLSPRG
ncbi:hypothetical protein ASG40_11185 [Methylobacterium sp. Leaf399]|uniref:hypothetical protein n=1 Tax=unclassified Methylobacterium TaxID=2615210 RepID=UPI0006F87BA2|nr:MULTISPECIES: hypothetical protein [unclassified Methylobacterium]KQP54912.1 hypothetical protein ASF39_03930 [Methylobacterium sp. Leaf108]KQT09192.1 hypothetical protein ASG40_11185 [Methylobacterium sp. Leaf399]KQT78883.1 hypothetical protein ASG59_06830 [Methylobacterium sp. Leaf466]